MNIEVMKMEEINGDKIKIILNDLDEEFYRFLQAIPLVFKGCYMTLG